MVRSSFSFKGNLSSSLFKAVSGAFAKSTTKTLLVCRQCGFIQENQSRTAVHKGKGSPELARPWQGKTVQRIVELVASGKKKIILDGPTGSGKTRIALLALKELQKTRDLRGLVTVRTITEMRAYDRDIAVFGIPLRYKYLIGKRRGCSYWTEGDDRGSQLCDACLLKTRKYDPDEDEYRTYYDEENARRIRDPELISKELKLGLAYLEQRYVKNEEARVCLYRSLKEIESDFDLASYLYLLNPSIREASGIDLEKSIVVVDEAHNLETACQDNKIISISLIDSCSREFRERCLPLIEDWRDDRNRARVSSIYEALFELRKIILNFAGDDQTQGRHLDKVTFASEVKRNPRIVEEVEAGFKKIELLKQNLAKAKVKEGLRNPFFSVFEFLEIVEGKEDNGYELFSDGPGKLLLRSVDPSLVLSALNNAGVLILMSGTMPPTDYVEKVWGITGCEEIRITHDYPEDYYAVFPREAKRIVISENISSKFDERNDELWSKYAEIIDSAFSQSKSSTLVCCSSYQIAEKIRDRVKSLTYLENRSTSLEGVLHQISTAPDSRMVIIAVAHGKILEGVEFVRDGSSLIDSVVIAGVPYPVPDEMYKWRLKKIMQRLGISPLNKRGFEDEYFMHIPALVTVRQAIGRAIRFPSDVATIYLADRRFSRFAKEIS